MSDKVEKVIDQLLEQDFSDIEFGKLSDEDLVKKLLGKLGYTVHIGSDPPEGNWFHAAIYGGEQGDLFNIERVLLKDFEFNQKPHLMKHGPDREDPKGIGFVIRRKKTHVEGFIDAEFGDNKDNDFMDIEFGEPEPIFSPSVNRLYMRVKTALQNSYGRDLTDSEKDFVWYCASDEEFRALPIGDMSDAIYVGLKFMDELGVRVEDFGAALYYGLEMVKEQNG